MTDPANKIAQVFPPLPDGAIVYRGIRNKWINTDEDDVIDQQAFRLRKDEKAISQMLVLLRQKIWQYHEDGVMLPVCVSKMFAL